MDGENNGEANMSTAIATVPHEQTMTPEQVDLIRRTICQKATPDELQLFLHQCKRTGLDPLSRQIHAVKRWDSQKRCDVMTIQTGIDGFRLIAERTGKYAGNDDPIYDCEDADHPNKATVTVWKIVAGQRVPFTRSARWSEFVQTKKDGGVTHFWQKMPYLMLGKVAEALALRAAFPQELSGLYTQEEMSQADDDAPAQIPAPQVRQTVRQDTQPAPVPVQQPADRPQIEEEAFALLGEMAAIRGKVWDDAFWHVQRSLKTEYASLEDMPYGILTRVRDAARGHVETMRKEQTATVV